MRNNLVSSALLSLLFLAFSAALWAEDAGTYPITWDENATAESLGLEPLVLPDDLYPVYPWDQVYWSKNFMNDPAKGYVRMAECDFSVPAFVEEKDLPDAKRAGFRNILLAMGTGKIDLLDAKQEEIDAFVKEHVAGTKDDPEIFGYYITDEPGAKKYPALAMFVAAVKKYAPGKLAYINLFPSYATTIGADVDSQMQTYTFTEYLERYVQEVKPQFISYDNYMVEYSEDMTDQERADIYWRDLLEVRRVAQKYGLPWWNIVSSLAIRPQSSPPNMARMALQAYTSLAAGANGLGWFLFFSPGQHIYGPINMSDEKSPTFQMQRTVNEQTVVLGKILNRFRSTSVWFSQPTDELPGNPGDLLRGVNISYQEEIKDKAGTPSVMVGEFRAKEGTQKAVMLVNLDFGRSIIASLDLKEAAAVRVVNPVTGTAHAPRQREWILPGHGLLFLID
ncbi:MAG: hypothetical protein IJH68_04485 [Thermoguttaceae bacterium]|nr:hypothetical protein [Thermoguttaceae bacterium]MBQ6619384.1 hypothetical protein [Thermoguttaceae bacterium]